MDEVQDVWELTDLGNYTCVDCEDTVAPYDTLGNRKFGEPRCLGCYEDWRRS